MANTKSALKNIRKNERRRLHNQAIRSRTRTAVKKARQVIASGQAEEAREAIQAAYSALDKAAKKNIIHKNNAARRKARLMGLYHRTFSGE